MTETLIHVSMRKYLKNHGWTLIAGEYPGGTDDELYVFSIMDPAVARDNSPDPRRHSEGEIVPDLLAYKDGIILVIEAKPKYSTDDKQKLERLFTEKRGLLINSLDRFCRSRHILPGINVRQAEYVPTLAFGNPDFKQIREDTGFAHIYVRSLDEARLIFF